MAKKKKVQKKKLKVRAATKPKKAVKKKAIKRKVEVTSKARQPQTPERSMKPPMAKAAAAVGSRGVQNRFAGKPDVEPKETDEIVEEVQDVEADLSDDESSDSEIPPDFGGEN